MQIGVDFGTGNIVVAKKLENGVGLSNIRDAFVDIENTEYAKKMLVSMKVSHAETKNRLLIIGEPAFELANIFRGEVRRPMKDGAINPEEVESIPVLRLMVESLIGASTDGEKKAVFNYPADPVDSKLNISYHRRVIDGLLTDLGYKTQGIHEGMAVVLNELASEEFTGIGLSFGAGMANLTVAYRSMDALSLSTSRSGDFIDMNAAMVTGSTVARMTKIKEEGMDIQNPKTREQSAIAIFYKEMIQYTIAHLNSALRSSNKLPEFKEPVIMSVAGGTAKVGGFIEEIKKNLPNLQLPIKDVRLANDPLATIAKGNLVACSI